MIPDLLKTISPVRVSLSLVMISLWLVVGALFMQFFMDIRPCELCFWQRYPHVAVIFSSVLVGLRYVRLSLIWQIICYTISSILALYHSGIERKWWQGLSGCSATDIKNLSIDQLYTQLLSTEIVKCDEISWSLFGLSLTNYNLILSLILGLTAFYFIRGYDAQAKHHAI